MATHYDGSASTVTTEQHFIPEIWADGIYKYFERKSVFRGLVDDYSALVSGKGYGDAINIPELSLISASAKSAGADVSYDATATTTTQLSLNKHKYVAKLFEDIALIQSEADLVSKYTRMMGEALARQVDSDIWTELQSLEDSLNLGTDEEGDASGGVNFMIDLMDLNSTTSYKTANGIGVAENQNGDYYGYRTHAYIQSTSAVNFFKIFTLQGGNLDSGTVTLYGYEK